MPHRAPVHMLFAIAATLTALTPTTAHVHAQDDADTHTVTRGPLELRVNQSGRIESGTRTAVTPEFEALAGNLTVAEVVHTGGPIAEGDVILRLESETLDRQLEDAQRAVASAEQSLTFTKQEQSILAEANAVRLERAQVALQAAEHAFEIFDTYTGERLVRQAEMRVQQSEFSLENQREELAQLKAMYDEATLASETRDIVIRRNERQIQMAEEYLQFAREDLIIAREYTYPDQKQSVENNLRWATIELAHAQMQTAMAEARKVSELDRAQRAFQDAEEKLADLKADADALTIRADHDGVLTAIDLPEGASVRSGQSIAEIVNAKNLLVRFDAQPADLRILAEGDSVDVTFPDFPEVTLPGVVESIADVGRAQGNTTMFGVTVRLSEIDPAARVGMHCTVSATSTLANVLSVPKTAVKSEHGTHTCTVVNRDGEAEARAVTIGASNDSFVQIVDGLREGDRVHVKNK